MLDWLEKHTECEVLCEEEEEAGDGIKWVVHERFGSVNDREWRLVGGGATLREAIAEAMA